MEGSPGSGLHSGVRVRQRPGQAWHNGRQTCAQLARCAVRHGAQQLDAALLGAPLAVLDALQQRRQHQLDACAQAECLKTRMDGMTQAIKPACVHHRRM